MRRHVLLGILILTTVADLVVTIYNLKTRPLDFEGNSLYVKSKSLWWPIIANALVIFLCYRLTKKYPFIKAQFRRYVIVTLITLITILHILGVYSNVSAMHKLPHKATLTEQEIQEYKEMQPTKQQLMNYSKLLNVMIYLNLFSLLFVFKVWEWVDKDVVRRNQ